jgi:hypothetical protein
MDLKTMQVLLHHMREDYTEYPLTVSSEDIAALKSIIEGTPADPAVLHHPLYAYAPTATEREMVTMLVQAGNDAELPGSSAFGQRMAAAILLQHCLARPSITIEQARQFVDQHTGAAQWIVEQIWELKESSRGG